MATSDQLKALLKSHVDRDEERFYSIAMQIAATEARSGHGKLAGELKSMIDEAKDRWYVAERIPNAVLEEDPKLLMWYEQAITRTGGNH